MRCLPFLLLCACSSTPASPPQEQPPQRQPNLHTADDARPIDDLHLGMGPPGSVIASTERPAAPQRSNPALPASATVSGGLQVDAVHRVINRHRRALRKCGEDRVIVYLSVQSDGRPHNVRTEPDSPCVRQAFSDMVFPEPSESVAEISWPWPP